jgi:hypothetical protein
VRTPQTEKQTLDLLKASIDRSSSIKVFEDGVPLSAIARIEIRDPLDLLLRPCQRRALAEARKISGMSESEARLLRDQWLAQWPEVARFLRKK